MWVETDSYPAAGGLQFGYQLVAGRPARRQVLSAAGGFGSAAAAREAGEAVLAKVLARAAQKGGGHGRISHQ